MTRNNRCELHVVGQAMTKMELRRKRKAARDDMQGKGNRHSMVGLNEESTSASTSSGDLLRGEQRSKRREDSQLPYSTTPVVAIHKHSAAMVPPTCFNLMRCPILIPYSFSSLKQFITRPQLPHTSICVHRHVTNASTLGTIQALNLCNIHSFVPYHVSITNDMLMEQREGRSVHRCVHQYCPPKLVTYVLPLQVPIHSPLGLPDFPYVQDMVYHTSLHGSSWQSQLALAKSCPTRISEFVLLEKTEFGHRFLVRI